MKIRLDKWMRKGTERIQKHDQNNLFDAPTQTGQSHTTNAHLHSLPCLSCSKLFGDISMFQLKEQDQQCWFQMVDQKQASQAVYFLIVMRCGNNRISLLPWKIQVVTLCCSHRIYLMVQFTHSQWTWHHALCQTSSDTQHHSSPRATS